MIQTNTILKEIILELPPFVALVDSVKSTPFNPANPLSELRDKAQQIFDAISEVKGNPYSYRTDIQNRLNDLNNSNAKSIDTFRKYKKELVNSLKGISLGFV